MYTCSSAQMTYHPTCSRPCTACDWGPGSSPHAVRGLFLPRRSSADLADASCSCVSVLTRHGTDRAETGRQGGGERGRREVSEAEKGFTSRVYAQAALCLTTRSMYAHDNTQSVQPQDLNAALNTTSSTSAQHPPHCKLGSALDLLCCVCTFAGGDIGGSITRTSLVPASSRWRSLIFF